MRFVFDSSSIPTRARVRTIRDRLAEQPFPPNDITGYWNLDDDFSVGIEGRRVGRLTFADISSSKFSAEHTPARARREAEETLLLGLSFDRLIGTVQDGRDNEIAGGDFSFLMNDRPYSLATRDVGRRLALHIPKRELVERFGPIDDLTATTFSSKLPVQRLAANFFVDLAKTIDHVDDATAERLVAQGLDLLVFSMSQQLGGSLQNTTVHRSALLFRLKSFIISRLRNPNLSLAEAAAAFGVSPRYVNSLLATQQTSFGRFVLEKRLQGCRRDLGDPRQLATNIIDIAFRWGFNDAAHFSRAFKARFGLAPRDFQQQAHLDRALAPSRRRAAR